MWNSGTEYFLLCNITKRWQPAFSALVWYRLVLQHVMWFRLFHPWTLDNVWLTMLWKWFLAASYLYLPLSTMVQWVLHTLAVYWQTALLTLGWTRRNLRQPPICFLMSISLVTSQLTCLLQHCFLFLPSLTPVLGMREHQPILQYASQLYWLLGQVIAINYSVS